MPPVATAAALAGTGRMHDYPAGPHAPRERSYFQTMLSPASPRVSSTRRRRSRECLPRSLVSARGPDKIKTVYDPTCGSGSLLLKAAAEAPGGVTIYGQEKDNATWALSIMNMILHGNEVADIQKGDTLTSPEFTSGDQLRTFDFVVMNPPFSTKSWSNGLENEYGRFEFGRPPAKNGDYAFLLHVLKSLKSSGKAAVILPHGVLFRGGAEASIRRQLLQRGYIKGIIGLPSNLFYGTGIPACIVVLDKENAQGRTGVFMIDASKGFMKDGPKNRLRSQDIHKMVDVFNKQTQVDKYSRMVPLAEIADAENDYNLNIARYIDSSEPEDLQDLLAHLHGGIPEHDLEALAPYWDAFSSLRTSLFKPNRPGYSDLAIDVNDVQQAILDSPDFKKLATEVRDLTIDWYAAHRDALKGINANTKPNDLIAQLGDDLLARFKSVPLLDEYDVYEQLMNYWHGTMHDDVFLIMNDGWVASAKPRKTIEDKDRKLSETPDLVIGSGRSATKYKTDLIPPGLIAARYFVDEQTKLDELVAIAEEAMRAIDDYTDEHAVEDGLLAEAMEDDKISKALAIARLKEAKREGSDPDEINALTHFVDLYGAEAVIRGSNVKRAAIDWSPDIAKYWPKAEPSLRAYRLEQDDIVIAMDGALVGRSYGRIMSKDLPAYLVQRVARLRGTSIDQSLLYAWIGSEGFVNYVDSVKTHTAIPHISPRDIRNFPITAPLAREEQRRVASVLEDVDELVISLERLIVKKRAIKQGVIQQLLSGRTRLHGFKAEWRETRLGDLLMRPPRYGVNAAAVPSSIDAYTYIRITDIDDSGRFAPRPRVGVRHLNADDYILRDGELVFARTGASVGKSYLYDSRDGELVYAGFLINIAPDPEILEPRYLALYAQTSAYWNWVSQTSVRSGQPGINGREYAQLPIVLPDIREQRAIASVLQDIDEELWRLNDRLTKAKAVKHGMTQELLSGRARLPVGEVTS
jgi:restriction endonuclease S subunit